MRSTSYLVGCVLALGLGINVASADVVTVSVAAHVTSINDSSLPLALGQAVTATYSYDTLTSPVSNGTYQPVAPPATISVSAGGQTWQSQSNWTYQVTVSPNGGFQQPAFDYSARYAPSAGAPQSIDIFFDDSVWPTSTALPTDVPPASFGLSYGQISVIPPNGSGGFVAQVDTVTLLPSLTISPASSNFLAQQNFDAVVLLSSQISITSMQASVAGTPISLSYPGTCQLAPANNAGRTALVCPNASAVLATLGGGSVTIAWQVVLGDGSTIQQSVIWSLVQ